MILRTVRDNRYSPYSIELQLTVLMAANKDSAHWIKKIHEAGATLDYFLVGLHALAALYQRYCCATTHWHACSQAAAYSIALLER